MFIAIARGGEYQAAWKQNLAVSNDKAKLENLINIERQKTIDYNVLCSEFNIFRDAFIEVHTKPVHKELIDVPRWQSGIRMDQITIEMRAERDVIHTANDKIRQNNEFMDVEFKQTVYIPALHEFMEDKILPILAGNIYLYKAMEDGYVEMQEVPNYSIEEIAEI